MSFNKFQELPSLLGKRWAHIRRASLGGSRLIWRPIIAAAIILPFGLIWFNPFYINYAVFTIIILWSVVLWWQWPGWGRLASWVTASIVLFSYWSSTFMMWLFLENIWNRLALLLLTSFFTWWYLREWQRLRLTLFMGEAGAGSTPTLVLGFLTCFALGSSAESFLVYLNIPVWLLTILFFIPAAAQIICFSYASGWSLVKRWLYWFTGLAVMLQIFLMTTWWPTSFYVIGFTQAAAFALIALILRQESQGFISKRSFGRELSLVLGALILVLLTARWY